MIINYIIFDDLNQKINGLTFLCVKVNQEIAWLINEYSIFETGDFQHSTNAVVIYGNKKCSISDLISRRRYLIVSCI